MKTRLIILVFILFIFNKQTKAQYDTIFLNIPELIINNKSFIYDLDTMFQKSYLCEIKDGRIFTIYVKQTSEESYLFTILQAPLEHKRLADAKGFFKINGINFFVVGNELLSEYPKELFTTTNNQQQFYYLKDKEWVTYNDGTCWIDLEYRDEKLFFIKKYR
ncbi:MAG: hypothetical protein PHH25_09175 [Bacteroidales bacterium]|nr:hypothetical protein [Bacteroidales bacterium]